MDRLEGEEVTIIGDLRLELNIFEPEGPQHAIYTATEVVFAKSDVFNLGDFASLGGTRVTATGKVRMFWRHLDLGMEKAKEIDIIRLARLD